MKKQLLVVALASLASVVACEPSKPGQPSFARDVQPIFEAHCVRCHGAGGTLNTDPSTIGVYKGMPPLAGYFNQYQDSGNCPDAGGSPAGCMRGAYYYATTGKLLFTTYVNGESGVGPMPPPPAAQLTSWEHDVVFTWLNNPIP
jgi:hypothetical protein